ncbi:MAG: L-lysine 2,3-aminomutase [Candidatus Anoxychlamydiales bacterium]|uniref:Radical SAM core domain-containing protein n=1 Tax=marine sediment metagenome TaxID=412755 RepID=A0A0F9LSE9_9ZZZZ|nr:L-lysine 2,3-aminomutase [Candidatus Anoxychlamydiales bacterium]NGX41532.1 L-lysine 2,3-aminomutase [Candidatus Anoxychlamydiales bacterium]HEU64932.1 KamA family radical SAM protein [Chlamydiota bacterium]
MPKSFTNINKLIKFLKIDKKNQKKILLRSDFPLLLPYSLAKKIKKNDLTDPIFRQFVPLTDEILKKPGYIKDPLSEKKFKRSKLLKKYNSRALIITTNACLMHCRYCFRKHAEKFSNKNFDKEIGLIKKDKTITEIILSGGDPLTLSNNQIENLLKKLDKISHIKILRFHTRYVISDPKRIDQNFIKILKNIKKQIIFVFHINHPREIDSTLIKATQKLKKQNILLFNQSVLLKGVNDDFETLKNLNLKLIEIGIIPYYLHQLDKVEGSKHFEVPIKKGKELIKMLHENLSGYLIPKYVREIPNKKCKTLI